MLVARREDRLAELAEELVEVLASFSGNESADSASIAIHTVASDLSLVTAPQEILTQLETLGLSVDFLINNAGSAGPDLLVDRDWQAHRTYQELMMTSCAALTHLLVPAMVERGHGRVLNVASMAGRVMRANDTTYGPAKAWMIAHSEAMASTLRGTGVKVMALCPGFVRTEFHADPEMHALRDAIPNWLWYSPETVVREGLAALERSRVVFASGRLYRWVDPITQSVLTRWLLRRINRRSNKVQSR